LRTVVSLTEAARATARTPHQVPRVTWRKPDCLNPNSIVHEG
jgi:hypothetical protein